MSRAWFSTLAWLWSLPCNLLPVSWWLDHHESRGWRADVWIWFHAIWYGLGERAEGREFPALRESAKEKR